MDQTEMINEDGHASGVWARRVAGMGRGVGSHVYLVYEGNRVDMIALFKSAPVLRVPRKTAGEAASSRVELKIMYGAIRMRVGIS